MWNWFNSAYAQHWWSQRSKKKAGVKPGALEAASSSCGLDKYPWQPCYPEKAFTWRKRFQAMAVLTRTWSNSIKRTRRRLATAVSLWTIRSTHSSSASGGARQGGQFAEQWVLNSSPTRWSLSCSNLRSPGGTSSSSSHKWWEIRITMSVRSNTNTLGHAPRVYGPRGCAGEVGFRLNGWWKSHTRLTARTSRLWS